MKKIYILWLRQVKKYFRSRARIIGSLAQPLLFLFALGFGFGPIYSKAGGGNYIQFLVPGVVAMGVLFTSVFSGIEIIWDRQFGFLKETLVAPVSRLEIMIGRTLGGATVAAFQGLLIFALSFLAGFRIANFYSAPLALVFVFLISLFFAGVGTAIGSLLEDMQGFQLIVNFLIMPTFFLSGALFPLEGLPTAVSFISKMNPLTYGIDGLRNALAGQAHFSLLTDFSAMVLCSVAVLSVGTYFFYKIKA